MRTVEVESHLLLYKPDSTGLSTIISTQVVNSFYSEIPSSTPATEECCMETSGISPLPFLSPLPLCKPFSRDHQQFLGERYMSQDPDALSFHSMYLFPQSVVYELTPHTPCLFPISGKCPRKMNASVSRLWITE